MQKNGIHIHTAEIKDLLEHFNHCDEGMKIEVEKHISLIDLSKKFINLATLYEYWENDLLIGFAAVYENRGIENPAFVGWFSIDTRRQGRGFGSEILQSVIASLKSKKYALLKLYVRKDNSNAMRLYEKFGFSIEKEREDDTNEWVMQLLLN